jgi:hypothetical protein
MTLSLETGGLAGEDPYQKRLKYAAGLANIRNRPFRERQEDAANLREQLKPDNSVWRPGSGFRNTGAFRERALSDAALGARSKELGAPTSFRGGAGAPEPVAILRGTTTTYSPGRVPGAQFAGPEFATPTEARQDWNRENANLATVAADRLGVTNPRIPARFGTYVAPEAPTLEAASRADIKGERGLNLAKAGFVNAQNEAAKVAQDKAHKEQIGRDFDTWYRRRYSVYQNGKLIPATDEPTLRAADFAKEYALEQGNAKAGQNYMEWDRRLREKYPDLYRQIMSEDPTLWFERVKQAGPYLPAITYPATRVTPEPWAGIPNTENMP